MKKFLPYAAWIFWALILFASYTFFDDIGKVGGLDEINLLEFKAAHLIALIFPVFFRPIQKNLLKKFSIYAVVGFIFLLLFRKMTDFQADTNGICLLGSSIVPIVVLKLIDKKFWN